MTVNGSDERGPAVVASGQTSGTESIRASDAERNAVADRLHAALAEGRLDVIETEHRLAAVYGSKFRSDLIPLLEDLPFPETRTAGPWVSIRQDIVEQVWLASARWRGTPPTPTSSRQRRVVTALLVIALLWAIGSLLAGFAVGLVG